MKDDSILYIEHNGKKVGYDYDYDPTTGTIKFLGPEPILKKRKWWQFWKPKYVQVIEVQYKK